MKKRVGILASRLHDGNPRGVQRVARAIAEYLASAKDGEEFEFLCLDERVDNQHEITYWCCDLSDWLARHPLRTPGAARDPNSRPLKVPGRARRAVKTAARRCLGFVVPPLCFPLLLLVVRAIKGLLRSLVMFPLRLVLWARNGLRETVARARREEALTRVRAGYAPITPHELDAIVGFEVHEEIWRLPIENYPVKLVGWFHDAITRRVVEESRWNLDYMEKDLSNCVLKADRVVCVSQSSEKDLHTFFPRSRGKTCVVFNGHDVDRFRHAGAEGGREKVLARHGIDPRLPYLISVGGIEGRKNNINMIRACVHLRKRNPDLRFQMVFVGKVNRLPGFHFHVQQARRHLPVIHTGYGSEKDVAQLLSGARGLLYLSLWEGFGIPTLEAMSAGTLVIASDLGSLPEICGEHALFCDPYDPAAVADAIERTLLMPADERQARLDRAREYAARFTWDSAGEQVLGLLRAELADGKTRAAQPPDRGGWLEQGPQPAGRKPARETSEPSSSPKVVVP